MQFTRRDTPPTFVLASRPEEVDGKSMLEKARLVNPKSDALWVEAVRVEECSGAPPQGKALLARVLQECPNPTSNILWSMAIWSEARPQRKARSVDALRKCEGRRGRPTRDLYRCSAVLGRLEDREGTRVVRARCECGSGLGRCVGLVA